MNIKADLHLHTNASDGKLSAKELVWQAKQKDIQIISITDHDTVSSVEEAVIVGKSIGVDVIPGIELSTTHKGESIHMLGYFADNSYKLPEFQLILKDMIDFRVARGRKIVNNLHEHFGIKLDYDKIIDDAKGVIARPHIAKAIVEEGYDYNWEYIFKNIIGEKSPAYIPKKNLSVEEGLSLLKSVNAIVVLAHPILIKKIPIDELMKYDFDGIEAIYHMNSSEDTERFLSIAKRYNKIITAGSDFHGIAKEDNGHGSIGSVSLSGNDLEIFLSYLNRK
jgi:predicted metal-dependent phosphoesterase TrpH